MSLISWFQERFGRGSRVDDLIRALPNPSRIVAGADAWAQTTIEWGDRIAAWEPQESNLVDVIQATADALDVLGGLMGSKGEDKLAALNSVLRNAAVTAGVVDKAYDLAWRTKFRPLLEAYIARLRG